MKKPNSTMILNFRSRLINSYLEKGFYIIEKGSKQLIFLPNDVKFRINLNNQIDKDFFIAKKKATTAVEKPIKTLYIVKDIHFICKQDLYKDKQKEICNMFME